MILTHTGDVYSFFTWAQSEMAEAVPWPWQALGWKEELSEARIERGSAVNKVIECTLLVV